MFKGCSDINASGSHFSNVGGDQHNVGRDQYTVTHQIMNIHAPVTANLYGQQDLGQLRLHNKTSNEASTQTSSISNPFPPSQPVPPEIFFGRDDLVSDYASLLVRNAQTRLAILGSGGMGKTSLALHVLHNPNVVARYKDRRYFVGCDAIGSPEALAALILQIVRVPSAAGDNIVTVLHRALLSAPLTLLLLDNFETVWETNSRRDSVVDLLQKVVNTKNISLIITMRGTIPPSGITWTCFGCLPQLSPRDAKRVFLAINPSLSDGGRGDEECLDKLLDEMDYVPLAIQLLAQISIGFSYQYMLKRWNQEKTAMLCTHEGPPGKLESIEVSISLSLTTLDIRSNPATIQLLVILCQLPDGLHQWEERLPIISAGLQNIHHLVYLLRKTALIFIAGSSLKVLSPIRHFIHRRHNADPDCIQALENYFWNLVRTHAAVPMGPDFPHAKDILEPDMGNICSLIKCAAQIHPLPELVEIVLDVSRFQYFAIPSTEFLCDVMPLVKHVQTPTQEAQMLQCLGNILRIQAKYAEASELLTEAQIQFSDVGNVFDAAQCSLGLGDTFRMQAKYTEASEILTEAQQQFLGIGHVLGAAQCSRNSWVTFFTCSPNTYEAY